MVEAAVAYAQATGKTKLLDVAEKFMEHISTVFGPDPGKRVEVPGHEEIELALVKLYQYTGKQKYMDLAKFFLDARGNQPKRTNNLYGPYCQDHEPIRSQKEIVGHAVRAVYLYSGVTDVAAYSGDSGFIDAMDALWKDVVHKKMYITGGIGARYEGEAFGNAYELPNNTAYCETCAAIGLVFWAHRMNLLHGNAAYAEVVERALYNGVLAGIGLDGKHFFYVNPLESDGTHHRQPFFSCACCPTNVVRFVPSLPGYIYAVDKNGIVVNLLISSRTTITLPDGEVEIVQDSELPWQSKSTLRFRPVKNADSKAESFLVRVRLSGSRDYQTFKMNWAEAPVIELENNLKPVRMVADPRVQTNQGRVAVQRGPLVYCFEQVDNEVPVSQIQLARDPQFKEDFRKELLGGIVLLKCKNFDGKELTAIPYYAWDHRTHGPMAVWVQQEGLAKEQPAWSDGASLYWEWE